MSVFAAFVNGLTTETLGSTGLEEVEMAWLHEFRKKLTSALDVGRFIEMWNIRETHPKGRPVRTLIRYRMCAPDPALQEDAQSITKLAHILDKVLLHRKGTERTADEQRAKNSESTRAAPQEGGGQMRLGDEIDICETDLEESLALWGLERKTRSSNELLFSSGVTPLISCEEFGCRFYFVFESAFS